MRSIDFGLMEYGHALALQERLAAAIYEGREEETLLIGEHHSVYTTGRGGRQANLLDQALRVERVNRGGDVTWHGPGQVVGYPMLNLARHGRDLHRFIAFLEEMLMHTLHQFGIQGHRAQASRGVWTKRGKIAFVGVGVRRWITMHGFSLNVSPDLRAFAAIHPCGLAGCPLTSMAGEGIGTASVAAVKQCLLVGFEQFLEVRLPGDRSGVAGADRHHGGARFGCDRL